MIAQAALKAGTDVEAIKAARAGSATIGEAIASAIATIGENMTLRRAAGLSVDRGTVASYVHAPIADGLGRIGVLVPLQSSGDAGERDGFGRKLAVAVTARSPQSTD